MGKWIAIGLAAILVLAAWMWWGQSRHMRGNMGMVPGQHMRGAGLPRAMTSTFMAGVADGGAIVSPAVPETLSDAARMGKRGFEAKCMACHGENAAGVKGSGPPLVHKIYEPSHHGDYAFVLAVTTGVRAHHWPFGDMPPVEGLTQADALSIAAYVREVQQANGIN